ncbi:BatD family protein [Sideroxydans lithotrophicus]|uniref:DUF7939 domain-containing protein n=1 Tax=Sideroxydans lithotrophicus (strain ES-1) TaxID=580332 RepID=D5CPE0_SIDLE|nr:BatD family protein [Sideroxydans lithotrophicus]ADE11081.1 conserved hypothetical protein [Sideroxydans lithotrophicus ES-1]
MKNTILTLMTLTTLGLSLPASAEIGASLDRNQVGPGETVQLTLQHNGQTDSQPDLSPLKQDFEIVGRSSGSSIQIVNGKMNAQTQLNLVLLPKHQGKLHIPALQWDGDSSPFLPLEVSSSAASGRSGNAAAGNAPTGNAAHVFLTAAAEQKQPYVQAAVPMTVRIYTDQPLYQASLDLQSGNDVLVQQLGQDKQTSETRNGRSYQVIERRYLLFPQRSGSVRLDGAVLNAQVQDNSGNDNDPFGNIFGRNPFAGMMNTTRPIRIQSEPVVLNVRPRPAGAGGHDWLPAQHVTLEESWQPDNGSIRAGDPVTLHLHLAADGLIAAQLPDLSRILKLPNGLRAYPDQPKLNNDAHGISIIGTRDQDIAIIANTAGRYEIPALHLFWWDTGKNVQQEIELPARTLDVLPSAGGIAVGTTPPGQDSISAGPPAAPSVAQPMGIAGTDYRWAWISLVFALLWLGTLGAWWLSSRRKARQPAHLNTQATTPSASASDLGEARKAFRQACRDNDAQAARRHLLAWAHASWPQDPPRGLKALADRLDDAALKPLLKQLDRACYANGIWQGDALLNLKTLHSKEEQTVAAGMELAGLYP